MSRIFHPHAAACACLLATLISGSAGAQSAEEIRAELERQQALLDEAQRAAEGRASDEGSSDRPTDPRVAPRAPEERELPVAIFDTAPVQIPKGTWDNPKTLELERRSLDADGDDVPELVRWVDPESQYVVRQEADRNFDGTTDAWSDYEWGALVRRVVDENDDGNPDGWERYEGGVMVEREIDRNDDGTRDAFYRYADGSLEEERHDANDDGKIDLRIEYRERLRVRAEEDVDRDGRFDQWTIYAIQDGREVVLRIERDRKGRGSADTFEHFEQRDGQAVLVVREEDLNGDGEIDVYSYYERGRLVRREIQDPELLPTSGG